MIRWLRSLFLQPINSRETVVRRRNCRFHVLKVTELKEELTKRMHKTPAKWPRKAELVKMLEQIIRESDG
eukprot:COSAG06_NODE_55889_length_287_cov_1.079787_1_plen_69_part_01